MNHDEILDMLRRAGVEVPSGEDPIDVEVEVEDASPDGADASGRGGKKGAGRGHVEPKSARERKKAARTKRAKGSHIDIPVPPFMERLATWSRTALIVMLVVLGIAALIAYWWFHPALNIHSPRVWNWIILISIVCFVGLKVFGLRSEHRSSLFNRLALIPVAVVAAFFIGLIMG